MSREPQFRVAYDGETEYTWNGKTFRVRHAYSSCSADKVETNARIGCVWACSGHDGDDYPPVELMAHFPGYVRGRYRPTGETYLVETTCGPISVNRHVWETETTPQVVHRPHGLFAKAWADELDRYERDRLAREEARTLAVA